MWLIIFVRCYKVLQLMSAQIIFWDASIKKPEDVDIEALDEAKSAELASEKYQWSPVLQIDVTSSRNPERQMGILKIIMSADSQFFCCNEVGKFVFCFMLNDTLSIFLQCFLF